MTKKMHEIWEVLFNKKTKFEINFEKPFFVQLQLEIKLN